MYVFILISNAGYSTVQYLKEGGKVRVSGSSRLLVGLDTCPFVYMDICFSFFRGGWVLGEGGCSCFV